MIECLGKIKTEAIKNNTLLVVMSSNFSPTIRDMLTRTGVVGIFDLISGAENERSKQKRINLFLKQHGLKSGDKQDVLYIGDTAGDVLEAHRLGIRACAVTWGFHAAEHLKKSKPDLVAATPEELRLIVTMFIAGKK